MVPIELAGEREEGKPIFPICYNTCYGMTYRIADESELGKAAGAVVKWDAGVIFRCPCSERQVYVASPPHTISWDVDSELNLDGSVGSRAQGYSPARPANWCHFFIKNGEAEMCADAQCPGNLS